MSGGGDQAARVRARANTPATTRDALLTVDRRVKRAVEYLMESFPLDTTPEWVDLVHPKDVAHILRQLRDVQMDLQKLTEHLSKTQREEK